MSAGDAQDYLNIAKAHIQHAGHLTQQPLNAVDYAPLVERIAMASECSLKARLAELSPEGSVPRIHDQVHLLRLITEKSGLNVSEETIGAAHLLAANAVESRYSGLAVYDERRALVALGACDLLIQSLGFNTPITEALTKTWEGNGPTSSAIAAARAAVREATRSDGSIAFPPLHPDYASDMSKLFELKMIGEDAQNSTAPMEES